MSSWPLASPARAKRASKISRTTSWSVARCGNFGEKNDYHQCDRPERISEKASQEVTERFQPTARAAIMVESFSNEVEAVMTYASRLLAGILLIVLPTVMVGGVSILPL
jgi:hypothetical protein